MRRGALGRRDLPRLGAGAAAGRGAPRDARGALHTAGGGGEAVGGGAAGRAKTGAPSEFW